MEHAISIRLPGTPNKNHMGAQQRAIFVFVRLGPDGGSVRDGRGKRTRSGNGRMYTRFEGKGSAVLPSPGRLTGEKGDFSRQGS